jgi:hypothetical protein
MKHIGSLDIRGQAKVKEAPTDPTHVMRKLDVEALVGSTAPPLYIVNVTPTSTGIVGEKNFVANTVPVNQVLEDCVANTYNIRVHVLAEGDSTFYSPVVDVNGVNVALSEHPTDKRLFEGYADVVMTEDGILTATSSSDAETTANITFLIGGPVVQTLVIDSLPGSQTTVKEDDIISISGTVANDATSMSVENEAAAKGGSITLGAIDSAGAGFRTFTGSAITSAMPSAYSASFAVTGTNSLGTEGEYKYSPFNGLEVDQAVPQLVLNSITYPSGQTALKGSESATLAISASNFESIEYIFDDGTVADPNSHSPSKVATLTGAGDITSNNFTVNADKPSNGSSATLEAAVHVATTVSNAGISILGNPARLRSSDGGENYVVRVLSTQTIREAPTLSPSVNGGTFTGGWTSSNGGKEWRRTINIKDSDDVGAHTFTNFSYVNGAGVTATEASPDSDADYTIGGMTFRSLIVPAFSQIVALGSNVGIIVKCSGRYAGADDLLALRNDTANVTKSFTITDSGGNYDPNGDYFFINDAAFAGSNTSGTLVVEFEEIV